MVPTRLSKPNAVPKIRTRLTDREKSRQDDERLLEDWKRAVRARDGQRCRVCKRRVVVSLELRANRAECHHITGRSHKPTRYDVRNGVLVCLGCHTKIEDGSIQLMGTTEFTIGDRAYVDGSAPIVIREFKA